MPLTTIEQEWDAYSTMIYDGISPSPVQFDETRRAFFAGGYSVFALMSELAGEDVSESDAFKYLTLTTEFFERFKTSLIEEAAADTAARPARLIKDMNEPELADHLNNQLRFIKACQTGDTVGSMLVIFQDDGITQYGATIDPETAPQALRELADRIERRETVKRAD